LRKRKDHLICSFCWNKVLNGRILKKFQDKLQSDRHFRPVTCFLSIHLIKFGWLCWKNEIFHFIHYYFPVSWNLLSFLHYFYVPCPIWGDFCSPFRFIWRFRKRNAQCWAFNDDADNLCILVKSGGLQVTRKENTLWIKNWAKFYINFMVIYFHFVSVHNVNYCKVLYLCKFKIIYTPNFCYTLNSGV